MSASFSTPTATASRRSSSTTATAPASDIVGPMDYRDGQAVERGEHVGALTLGVENMAAHCDAGPRRDDRPRSTISAAASKFVGYDELMRVMEADKVDGRGGRPRLLPHRLRPGDPRHEQEPRRGDARTPIPAPGSTAATSGSSTGSPKSGARRADLRQLRGRGASRRGPATARIIAPRCRCTRTACSSSASISARSGSCRELADWLRANSARASC